MQRINFMLHLLRRYRLALVLVVALLLRMAFLVLLADTLHFDEGAVHGSVAYDDLARNLLETGVYGRTPGVADSVLPPLYSVILAGVYGMFGRGFVQIALFHIVLDLLSISLLYAICRRLFRQGSLWGVPHGDWVGTLAGLFYAAYPYLIFQNLTLNDTALWIFLLHAFVLLLILLRGRTIFDRWTLLWALLAGLVLGLAMLTRALLPLFALLAALWFLFRLNLWQTVLRLGIVAIVGVLIVLPWMIRAYGIYGGFVTISLNGGENLYQGANAMTIPLLRSGYDAQWSIPPENSVKGDPYTNNQILLEAGLDYLREQPEEIPALIATKFLVHWDIRITPHLNPQPGESFALAEDGSLRVLREGEQLQDVELLSIYNQGLLDTVGRPVHMLYYGGLLALAIIGSVLAFPHWREVSLLWFLQFSMMVMYIIFHPSTRYRVPTDPLLFALSAYALVVWLQAIHNRRQS